MKWFKRITKTFMLMLAALSFMLPQYASAETHSDDSSGFVVLSDVVPDIIQEIRYYSTYNFVGDRIKGYNEPCALMTKEAAAALNKLPIICVRKDTC